MTSCCPPPRMRWSGATGAIARCKRVSTGCGHKSRSGCVLHWICGVKPTPKAGNTPLQHFIVHGLDKPGSSATVSKNWQYGGVVHRSLLEPRRSPLGVIPAGAKILFRLIPALRLLVLVGEVL